MKELLGIAIVCTLIWMPIHIHNQNKLIRQCAEQIDSANDSIDEANSEIDEARNAQWSDYDSMGDALGSLYPVEDVYNPCLDN
jgi:hypothetical protein